MFGAQPLRGLRQPVHVAGYQNKSVLLGRQRAGERGADAGRGAGDESGAAGHGYLTRMAPAGVAER
jgi:hypothetical protein